MSTQENVHVKDFFAAMGGGDKQRLLALAAEDIEWIIPGEPARTAGTRDWRMYFRRLPKRLKLHSQSPPNS
jgi:ketosteroid isomerase-like protein